MTGLYKPLTPFLTVGGFRQSYKPEKPFHFCLVSLREGRALSNRMGPISAEGEVLAITRVKVRTLSANDRISS